jgi:2-polyprenyl-6-methoxyphenol hydroxylase-like FAD-dependent oxidoreductase
MRLDGSRFDVAVVGASLAGCTTATLLGRAGLHVALIDKHSGADAYKRLCGHYIQASARPVLERLGLVAPIEAAGAIRNGADVWTRWGVVASPEPPGERPYGYSIRRSKLDPMARALACATAGVEYMPGREAVGLLDGDEQPRGIGRRRRRARDAVAGVELRDRRGRSARLRAPGGQRRRSPRAARLRRSAAALAACAPAPPAFERRH